MKTLKFLLAGEPIETFHPDLDTGVLLSTEILARGHSLDYLNLVSTPYQKDSPTYLRELPVCRVRTSLLGKTPAFELEQMRSENAQNYDVILQRKDPPVDEVYKGHARHFAQLPKRIIQMNHPSVTPTLSEHLLPQEFPQYSIPTFLCRTYKELEEKVRSSHTEIVAKPIHLFSGIGVEFFSQTTPENVLRTYWENYKPQVVVQPYIDAITTLGDVRILVINEKIIGAVRRVPRKGSRLANLHQGASAEKAIPTPKQVAACHAVAKTLCPKGLYLLGLDFIGDYLTEVNITCPSALRQVNSMNGMEGHKLIIDELERMVPR